MQVLVRSTTSARPRVASPGTPVSDSKIASPTTTYARSPCPLAAQGRAIAAAANLARCIDGAGAAAFDLGEHAVSGLIDAGQREGIAGRDCIVAGADQPRYCRGRA